MADLTLAAIGFILFIDVIAISSCLYVRRWAGRQEERRKKCFEDEKKKEEKETTGTVSTNQSDVDDDIELTRRVEICEDLQHKLFETKLDNISYTAISSNENEIPV